jgi:hypothetical protein
MRKSFLIFISSRTVFSQFWALALRIRFCSLKRAEVTFSGGIKVLCISPYYKELAQRRAEQETEAFKEKMKRRPAVEGTISEMTRKHGMRRARYRGKGKVRLQAFFTGAAVNLKRLARALEAQEQAEAEAKAAI